MNNLFIIVKKKVIYSFICSFRKCVPSPYKARRRTPRMKQARSVSYVANLEPDPRNFDNFPEKTSVN